MSRISIRDIAKKLGLHHSTVSRALRNDQRISAKVRDQVNRAAGELGYSPDPMLSALMVYRSGKIPNQSFRGTLALITNYPTRDGWHQYEKIGFHIGASRQAKQLGYYLDVFWLHEPGMTTRAFNRILVARNVQGLIFIPQPRSHAHINLEWERFSAVRFGPTLVHPQLRMVDSDHFRGMAMLMRQLKRRGYRNPGFACQPRVDESISRQWSAAFWAYRINPHKTPPIFMPREWGFAAFKAWFQKHQPDVVVSHTEDILKWLGQMKLRVPEDVGYAITACHGGPAYCSGVDENNELIGETAVNVVVAMINRGERSIPTYPMTTQVVGFWHEGTTLRKA